MSSRSNAELNGHLELYTFDKRQMTARLPFLVIMRLRNLVYAATSENLQTDKSELTASLIAHAPRKPLALDSIFSQYQEATVACFRPEVDDMRVPKGQRTRKIHEMEKQASGVKLPALVYDRLGMLVDTLDEYDDEAGANLSTLTGALIVGATTNDLALESLITAYRDVTVADFDPAAVSPLEPAR